MDCPKRNHSEYADDDEFWKVVAFRLDCSAPELKAMEKWLDTDEGKKSNVGVHKVGAGATGPFRDNDASKLFPAIKCVHLRRFYCTAVLPKFTHLLVVVSLYCRGPVRTKERTVDMDTMTLHEGVVDAIEAVNLEIKTRRERSTTATGGAGWGKMHELGCVLTLLEQGWDQAFSTSNLQSGFLRTGSVGSAESRFADPAFHQYVRQLCDTSGKEPPTAGEMITATAAKDVLLPEGFARGELRDEEFHALGVQPDPKLKAGEKPRDEMQRSRWRGEILNKRMTCARHALYHEQQKSMAKVYAAAVAAAAAARGSAMAGETSAAEATQHWRDARIERNRIDAVQRAALNLHLPLLVWPKKMKRRELKCPCC